MSGILKSQHQNAVRGFIKQFSDLGYDVSVTLVNAKDFGVPQERRRVFFIGFRRDLNIQFKFPEGSTKNGNKLTLQDAIADLQYTAVPALRGNRHNPGAVNCNEYYTGAFSGIYMSRNRVKRWNQQAYTVQATGRHSQIHPQAPKMQWMNKNKYIFVPGKEYLYRRLTVRESARLQGFPDDFQLIYQNVDNAYKMIGNAVPVHLAYEIAVSIKEALKCQPAKVGSKVFIGGVRSTAQARINLDKHFYHVPLKRIRFYSPNEIDDIIFILPKQMTGLESDVYYMGRVSSAKILQRCNIVEIPKQSKELYVYFKIPVWKRIKTLPVHDFKGYGVYLAHEDERR